LTDQLTKTGQKMAVNEKKVVRYGISFKQQVVNEFENGISLSELNRKYGIGGAHTIQKWVKKFGKSHLLNKVVRIETMDERDRVKQLEDELKAVKVALADSMMRNKCLEIVIEEANKEYKTDLKKSFGTAAPKGKAKN
jgi:transposase